MEELKAVLSENFEIENREKSQMRGFLEFLDDEELYTWIKTNAFLCKSNSTSVKFSIQALVEEIKPVVAEKKEFGYRDISITTAVFGNFGLSGF